jgi:hypothetical protein
MSRVDGLGPRLVQVADSQCQLALPGWPQHRPGQQPIAVQQPRGRPSRQGQDPAHAGADDHPGHITPGRRVTQQPPQPPSDPDLLRIAWQRQVRDGDRDVAPPVRQRPGEIGKGPQDHDDAGDQQEPETEPREIAPPAGEDAIHGLANPERQGQQQACIDDRQHPQRQPASPASDSCAGPGPELPGSLGSHFAAHAGSPLRVQSSSVCRAEEARTVQLNPGLGVYLGRPPQCRSAPYRRARGSDRQPGGPACPGVGNSFSGRPPGETEMRP